MKDKNKADKKIIYIIALLIILAVSFIVSLSFGSVKVSVKDVIGAFVSPSSSPVSTTIIRDVRFPECLQDFLQAQVLP